ncbi:MAG: hypothetical protein M0R33_15395 [Methylomonas sp.]|jgi:hypothetical protein|uniref:hypothetical protein n=1 Tax=Methylomonas sp. TaxID=418 RepID=UPI0025F37656|nr:hypothetical protein [Methylomonas sp.]MCK9607827.1 hypothetical protein [Methylomonas sp.]
MAIRREASASPSWGDMADEDDIPIEMPIFEQSPKAPPEGSSLRRAESESKRKLFSSDAEIDSESLRASSQNERDSAKRALSEPPIQDSIQRKDKAATQEQDFSLESPSDESVTEVEYSQCEVSPLSFSCDAEDLPKTRSDSPREEISPEIIDCRNAELLRETRVLHCSEPQNEEQSHAASTSTHIRTHASVKSSATVRESLKVSKMKYSEVVILHPPAQPQPVSHFSPITAKYHRRATGQLQRSGRGSTKFSDASHIISDRKSDTDLSFYDSFSSETHAHLPSVRTRNMHSTHARSPLARPFCESTPCDSVDEVIVIPNYAAPEEPPEDPEEFELLKESLEIIIGTLRTCDFKNEMIVYINEMPFTYLKFGPAKDVEPWHLHSWMRRRVKFAQIISLECELRIPDELLEKVNADSDEKVGEYQRFWHWRRSESPFQPPNFETTSCDSES